MSTLDIGSSPTHMHHYHIKSLCILDITSSPTHIHHYHGKFLLILDMRSSPTHVHHYYIKSISILDMRRSPTHMHHYHIGLSIMIARNACQSIIIMNFFNPLCFDASLFLSISTLDIGSSPTHIHHYHINGISILDMGTSPTHMNLHIRHQILTNAYTSLSYQFCLYARHRFINHDGTQRKLFNNYHEFFQSIMCWC